MTKKLRIPGGFELKNILQEKGPLPPPRKPRIRKCELYQEPTKFKDVDDHAQKVANTSHRFFRDLIWHLVHSSSSVNTDLDRVRVIYQWLITRDFTTPLFTEELQDRTIENLLKEFQQGKRSHAQVFQVMCLYAGIYCKVVTGVAKGRDFRPGDPCGQDKFRHCWNVVCIKDSWFPIDAKWGSKQSLNDKNDGCSEFYFLTDPDQLQLSHLAEEPRWQLVDRPINLPEFEHLPFVKPHFFKCGLSFISNVKAIIETRRGQVKWDIGLSHPTKFSFKLFSAETGKENVDNFNLKDFVFHEIHNGRATFILRSPAPGLYYLKIFAKPVEDRPHKEQHKFLEVLSYKVLIDRSSIEDDPLPSCLDKTWGPGERAERFCLLPVQKRGVISTSEKSINLEINKTRPVSILFRFCRNGWKEYELKKCVKMQDNETKTYLVISLPAAGEYGLEIYANIPSKPDVSYTHVCQYLISCNRRDDEENETAIETFLIPSKFRQTDTSVNRSVTVNGHGEENYPGEAPSSFVLKPVPEDDDSFPPPTPYSSSQHSAIISKQNMKLFDNTTRQVCEKPHPTFRDLMWDLIGSNNITNDFVKARVLYLWLATVKTTEIVFDDITEGSPEETLHYLNAGRTTYAMAYNTLCRYIGIPSKVITGVVKGMDYKPGHTLGGPGSNHHTWNAILLDNNWYFVDIRFARRPIISNLTTSKDVQCNLDDHFFLTDPSRFIYTHFPDEKAWQLLESPSTMDEICNMPVMTPHFFILGLDLISHKKYEIHSKGDTVISLTYPVDAAPLCFTFSVHSESKTEETDRPVLNKYGMFEAQDGKVTFRLRLPEVGSFVFYCYAKEDCPDKKENMFTQVCEYKIHQEEVSPGANPYPPCPYQQWGPGSAFAAYNLTTDRTRAFINTTNGMATVTVNGEKQMQYRTRLVQFNNAAEFEGYVTFRQIQNETVFSVTAPSRGEYGLEIYAKPADAESKKMRHVAQYMIVCDEDVQTVQLPKLPSGFLGQQPMMLKYGVVAASHPEPILHLDGNYVEVEFHTPQGMRFTASMTEIETKRDVSEYIFIQSVEKGTRLCVVLPNTGFFVLLVHGNLFEDNSQQIPGLFNYLINCKNMTQTPPVVKYPKQFGFWKEGCFMWEPLAITPKSETVFVPFRVRIPRATTVAVVVNQDWTSLDPDDTMIWEGKIEIVPSDSPTKIVLVASYGDNQNRFASLLEYVV